jgi:general L-amino acid transport system substrate-binding protein
MSLATAKGRLRFRALSLIALAIGFASFQAEAGEILARVQSRQMLRCGVSDGRLGFSYQDAKGRWSGLDVDFCRAVAAAVVGDAEKVKYFPLLTTARFLALRSNEVDLLARNTTWTIRREAGLGVHFVETLYYDGQGFMVSRKGREKKIADLAALPGIGDTLAEVKEQRNDWENREGRMRLISHSSMVEFPRLRDGRCLAYCVGS